MTAYVLKDASVVVNAVDLSDHVQSVTVDDGLETQDDTAMGYNARSVIGGLETPSIQVTFKQDFDVASVHDTLSPLFKDKTAHDVVVKPTSDPVSPTNPSATMTGIITAYPFLGGSVGDLHTTDVSWENAGTDGIAYATS